MRTEEEDDRDRLGLICPACGSGNSIHMGVLGARWWFRCRDCGIDFNIPSREPENCYCWQCDEVRPDTLDDCPHCGASCKPF